MKIELGQEFPGYFQPLYPEERAPAPQAEE